MDEKVGWDKATTKLTLRKEGVEVEVQGPADIAGDIFDEYVMMYGTEDGYVALRAEAAKDVKEDGKKQLTMRQRYAIRKKLHDKNKNKPKPE